MKEMQGQAERLWRENDQLRAQIKRSCNLRKDVQDRGCAAQPIVLDKEKEPISPKDVDTPTDNEISSSSSLSLSLSLAKNARENTKTRSCKRPSPHPAFSDVVSEASRRARREAGRRQYRPDKALENLTMLPLGTLPPMPPMHPTLNAEPTLYIPPTTLIRRPDDMLSSPLGQHILDYDPPDGFTIMDFTTFDVSTDPYDHMLHYNQAMTLNTDNDWLSCKVFLASLWGLVLA